MRVFVIGGTGFIGSALVGRLLERGDEVAALQRNNRPEALPPGVLPIAGTYENLPDIAEAVHRWRPDAVVDLVGTVAPDARRVFEAFAGHVARYVISSSGDVYANYGGLMRKEKPFPQLGLLGEDSALRSARYLYRGPSPRGKRDPQRFLDDYDKLAVEEAAQRVLGRRATILRLPMVYGQGNRRPRFAGLLRRMADNRPAIILTAEHARWRATYGQVDDVAEAILLALSDPEAGGQVFNVGEAQPTSWREWIERFATVTGWQGDIVESPPRDAPPHVAGFGQAMDLSYPLALDTSRIRAALGFAEIVDPDASIMATIEHELAMPEPPGGRPRDTYRDEDRWLAGARV